MAVQVSFVWSNACWFSYCLLIVSLSLPAIADRDQSHGHLNDHLCEHPEGKPYHIQGLTRTLSYLYVIESDNLYEIPINLLRPNSCHIKMSDENGPMHYRKWYDLNWTIGFIKPPLRFKALLNFVTFTEPYFSILRVEYVNEDSAYLQYVFPQVTFHCLNRTIRDASDLKEIKVIKTSVVSDNSTLVMDGVTSRKGYYIGLDPHTKRVMYYNLVHLLEAQQGKRVFYQAYYLQLTGHRRVQFVPTFHDPPISKDLIINRQPFGFIDKSDIYLMDVPTESVYKFPFVELGGDDASAGEEVPLRRRSMKSFFHCCTEEEFATEDPDFDDRTPAPLSRTTKILLITVVVVVVCLSLAMLLVIFNVKFREPKQNALTLLNQASGGHGQYRILSLTDQIKLNQPVIGRSKSSHSSTHRGKTSLSTSQSVTSKLGTATTTTISSKPGTRPKHSKVSYSKPQSNIISLSDRNCAKNRSILRFCKQKQQQPKSRHLPVIKLKPLIQQSLDPINSKERTFEFSVSNTNQSDSNWNGSKRKMEIQTNRKLRSRR